MKNKMATADAAITARETEHAKIATKIAAQGMVLLENKGVLPFGDTVQSIALFGSGARRTIKGGTGSGDVNSRGCVSVEQGLINVGYQVVSAAWMNEYDTAVRNARQVYDEQIKDASKENAFVGLITMMSNPFVAPDFRSLTQKELAQYPADAAVYVLSRISGEGADRKLREGDYLLTAQELADIRLLSQQYPKFVLLLNVGGVVELTQIKDLPGAILLMSQGGSGGGDAVAAVISGKTTPSGKLTTTWAKQYRDYPFAEGYAAVTDEQYDACYREGIYVGYRYFNTFAVEPLYPFGFGKAYTDFSIEVASVTLSGSTVTVTVTVENTGAVYSGREVVQVYLSMPEGRLSKASSTLATFGKTRELQPGEQQSMELSFSLEQFASYDESIAAWVLEKGNCVIYCGNSSRHKKPVAVVTVPALFITQQCKNLLRSETVDALIYTHSAKAEALDSIPHMILDTGCIRKISHTYSNTRLLQPSNKAVTYSDVKAGAASAEELVAAMAVEELATLCVGAARINLADVTLVGSYSSQIPGAAGETTPRLRQYQIPAAVMVDGPAGIRINPIVHEKDGAYINNPKEDPILRYVLDEEKQTVDLSGTQTKYQYCTALPIATMLAQTWDLALLEQAGQLVGAELALLGVPLWLAPGMNIQRNPLCGRNFEYYSEDPLVSGLCAAALTRGVQRVPGKGTTIKHLAANNQETNRNFNNSHVSERALREIYLKGYEICIKESQPLAAMTSVNLINGIHAANDKDMLTHILRDEWGFDGVAMTDWGTTGVPGNNKGQKYDCAYAVDCIKAGNDLIMPGSQRDVDYILAAVENGELKKEALQRCAVNVIHLLLRISDA